ncbi:calcium-binding protein, partial [Oleiphilus sp. HI0132]
GSDVLYGDEGNDRLNGGEQHDWLYGGEGDDQLYGGAGNDQIQGGKGDDVLSGGSGTDRLDGGAGNDTFIVKPGDGTIYITDTQGINILAFEGGLNAGDIYTYARPSSQDPTSDSFIKINYGSNESDVIAMSQTTFSYIREARFADGSSLSLIVDNLSNGTNLGTDSDDHITSDGVGSKHYYGFSGADTIDAGDGQDYVYGGDDNDAINGNSGD